jgi:uncharacterized protein YndB with AHSA1/START domain
MLAVISKADNGYVARFERELQHSAQEVWSYLTNNEKLAEWFPELSVQELREGGIIKFDMQNGTFEEMKIIEVRAESVLEYTWAEDVVRFELYPKPEGCSLVLIEKISAITNHTPRDLAGWHVCLDVIEALLDGRTVDRKDEWKKRYEEYRNAVNNV